MKVLKYGDNIFMQISCGRCKSLFEFNQYTEVIQKFDPSKMAQADAIERSVRYPVCEQEVKLF